MINTLNVALAFVEGVGLILSPCILPILPIMLAASLDGGKRRPLGIITGFIIAFTGFALLSRQILGSLHVDPQIVRNVALGFLIIFGGVMLSQKLSDKLIGATQGLANFGQNLTSRWDQKNGYFSGVAIGAMIGLIWTPCAGPIMAAAVVQIIQATNNAEATLTVIMFALGAGLPMLLIALMGRQVMNRLTFLKTHSHIVRRVLGVIIIGVALLIYSGADVQLLASTAPTSMAVTQSETSGGGLQKALSEPYDAPDIADGQWLNSPPIKISDLRGKVVLVDFWTYSCINCVRTLPYITAWDAKYRDKGLVIIGIHSPEFEFEKNADNVKTALTKYGIHYPVVLDNALASWGNFHNRYWPAHYLIDQNGRVVYTHFGEGDYDVTEHNIHVLLGLDAGNQQATAVEPMTVEPKMTSDNTPETYLGYARAARYVGTAMQKYTSATYHAAASVPENNWTLDGKWKSESQKITSTDTGASLHLHFKAGHVFLVMGTSDGTPKQATVTLNGAPIGDKTGKDVTDGTVTVNGHALYELVNQKPGDGDLNITATQPGLELYAFTFGD